MVVIRRTCASAGARALAAALLARGILAFVSEDGRRRRSLLINWGSLEPIDNRALNKPQAVAVARDKLATFNVLRRAGAPVPDFWTDKVVANNERESSIILERHTLTGQAGSGIVVKRQGQPLSDAPLYVRYIPKTKEYRAHVFDGQVIAVQEKRRESDAEQSADQKLIRNRDNGWVFCVQDVRPPEHLESVSVLAVRSLGLDFGAVDLILGKDDSLYVLEVNTRPGLESPTVLDAYCSAIQRRLNVRHDR